MRGECRVDRLCGVLERITGLGFWLCARGEAMAKDGSAAVKRVCVRDQGWEQGDPADDGPTSGQGETTAV